MLKEIVTRCDRKGAGMERLTQTSNSGGIAFIFDLYINCRPSEAKNLTLDFRG
jgi:hypothetical protein